MVFCCRGHICLSFRILVVASYLHHITRPRTLDGSSLSVRVFLSLPLDRDILLWHLLGIIFVWTSPGHHLLVDISWTSSSSGHLLDTFFRHRLLVDLWTSSSDIFFWTSSSAGLVPQGNYIIAVMEIYNLKKKNPICSYSLLLALVHIIVPEPPWSRGCNLCTLWLDLLV